MRSFKNCEIPFLSITRIAKKPDSEKNRGIRQLLMKRPNILTHSSAVLYSLYHRLLRNRAPKIKEVHGLPNPSSLRTLLKNLNYGAVAHLLHNLTRLKDVKVLLRKDNIFRYEFLNTFSNVYFSCESLCLND